MKHTFFDASGREVPMNAACDEHGCIRDGFRMRTKLKLMDGVPVIDDPFVPLTDEQKIARIDRLNAKLSDACRNPTPLATDAAPPPVRTGTADMSDVYERHDQRLRDAWRHPA
jgi:hypothetical protein